MISVRGIYNDINESVFYIDYLDFRFYFSSDLNRSRFKLKLKEEYTKLNKRLNNIYELDYTKLILLSVYKKVEKRGFRVYYNDMRISEYSIRIEV